MPRGLHPTFLGSRDAKSNRFDSLEALKPAYDFLVALRVLNHKFGLAIHGEDDGPPRLLHLAQSRNFASLNV